MRRYALVFLVVPLALVRQPLPAAHGRGMDVQTASAPAMKKLSPDLRKAVETRPAAPILVSALIRKDVSLPKGLMLRSVTSRPVGDLQWVAGEIASENLVKLGSVPGVISVVSTRTYQPDRATPDDGGKPARHKRVMLPGKTSPSAARAGKGPGTQTVKVADVHKARAAWAKGFTGQGVTVAVVDTGVDFGHPDLQGTQARIPSGPYAGWPFAYDTMSGVWYAVDPNTANDPTTYFDSYGYSWYCRTVEVTSSTVEGSVYKGDLAIDLYFGDSESFTFTWNNTSKSGKYRYTVHPDYMFFLNCNYEHVGYAYTKVAPPAVLVVDEHTPGVYDTVYIDTDFNFDFRGEKPLRKGDELAGLDLYDARGITGPDGTWDLSADMLTWISDGVNPPPGVGMLYPGQAAIPGAGELIAFVGDSETHGTNCASDIAAQGVITDPEWIGYVNPYIAGAADAGGVGGPVLQGMAPDVKIAAIENGFNLPFDSWTLVAYGFDGAANSGDEVQIVSNSWGASGVINDGWDPESRLAAALNVVAPKTVFIKSTGNDGQGYGTVASPDGSTIVGIGASTGYGSTIDFEYVYADQYNWGNVMTWSARGITANGKPAPDAVAVGAWGTGAGPLNSFWNRNAYPYGPIGQAAYGQFGGTSMACPVAAGVMGLIYQAFRDANGRYPTWREAKALLLAGAHDLSFDALQQGAGNVDADRSTAIAARNTWSVDPAQWTPGSYRGSNYAGFPVLMFADESRDRTFSVNNPGPSAALNLNVANTVLAQVAEDVIDWPLPAGNPPVIWLPTSLRNITARIDALDPDLVRAQLLLPYDQFDTDGNYSYDNSWRLLIYDWKDLNGDGNLWIDTNSDDVVTSDEIDIDPPLYGISEFNRMTYGYARGTVMEASVGRDCLSRRNDGVFVGVQRRSGGDAASLKLKVTYYKKTAWPWVDSEPSALIVPAGQTGTFKSTLTVPSGAAPGVYEGAIEVSDGAVRSVVPVVVNVAANSANFKFGAASLTEPPGAQPYDNGHMFGGFDWSGRYQSGDWRFFFYDIPDGDAKPGMAVVVDTRWDNKPADIDTWLFGPATDSFSRSNAWLFGPYTLEQTGGSVDANVGGGEFSFYTATNDTHEIVGGELRDGLNLIALHNVLSDGTQFAAPYTGQTYLIQSTPAPVKRLGDGGVWTQTFTSSAGLPDGIEVLAYGLSQTDVITSQVAQENSNYFVTSTWVKPIDLKNCGYLEIATRSSASIDVDLYLYMDGGDGVWKLGSEDYLVAYSSTYQAAETIRLNRPADGRYFIVVQGVRVPNPPQPFEMTINAIQGLSGLTLSNVPSGAIQKDTAVTFDVQWAKPGAGTFNGVLFVGPKNAPTTIRIPVTISDVSSGSVVDYLLDIANYAPGLDRNGDGKIDIADLIWLAP